MAGFMPLPAGLLQRPRRPALVAYAYLLRVPIVLWLALVAFAPYTLLSEGSARSLLSGLFDISNPTTSTADWWLSMAQFLFVTLAACFAVDSLRHNVYAIAFHAPERFQVENLGNPYKHRGPGWNCRRLAVGSLLWGTVVHTECGGWAKVIGIALGLGVFELVTEVAHRVVELYWKDNLKDYTPKLWTRWVDGPLNRTAKLFQRLNFTGVLSHGLGWCINRVGCPDGYFEPATKPSGRLAIDHEFGVFYFVMAVSLYLLMGLRPLMPLGDQPVFPTLAMLLCFVTLLSWVLTSLTFLLDYYRLPVLVPILAVATALSWAGDGEHYYGVFQHQAPLPSLPPHQVLGTAWQGEIAAPRRVILAAVTGGGIQSAAWASRVLTGLKDYSEQHGLPHFESSLRAISSVSGGSVGTMYFVAAYSGQGQLPDETERRNRILRPATASSLEDLTWGLLYPDVARSLFPFFWEKVGWLTRDRAYFLEQSWKRVSGLSEATLRQWREDAAQGKRPVVFLNSTLVETGQPLVFGTGDLFDRTQEGGCQKIPGDHELGACELHTLYDRRRDVPVVTAARLSATFPYVTPAARSSVGGSRQPQDHVVDGGYFDNYGLYTLLTWLDQGLTKQEGQARRVEEVLLVEIRSSPRDRDHVPEGARGWAFQGGVPLSTLVSTWGAGQLARNEEHLRLLRAKWQGRVNIQPVVFQFGECGRQNQDGNGLQSLKETPPLSWHLTPEERGAVESEWQSCVDQKQGPVQQFAEFLSHGQ